MHLPTLTLLEQLIARRSVTPADEEPEAEAGPSFTEIELDVVPEPRRSGSSGVMPMSGITPPGRAPTGLSPRPFPAKQR